MCLSGNVCGFNNDFVVRSKELKYSRDTADLFRKGGTNEEKEGECRGNEPHPPPICGKMWTSLSGWIGARSASWNSCPSMAKAAPSSKCGFISGNSSENALINCLIVATFGYSNSVLPLV